MKRILSALFGLVLCLAAPERAYGALGEHAQGALDDGEPRVEARLLVHPDRTAAGALRAGVLFTPDPGWHLYWKNPGDTGLPTQLAWRGGEAGPLRWPAPSAFDEDGLVTYGYEGTVLISSEIRPASGAEALGVDVDVLVCRFSCIPAKLSLERPLHAVYGEQASDAVRRLFALHDETLPREPAALGFRVEAALGAAQGDGRVTLAVTGCPERAPEAPCAKFAALGLGPAFFPAEAGLRVLKASTSAAGLTLELEREAGAPARIAGVLALLGGDGRIHHLDVEVSGGAPSVAAGRMLGMLALAMLGGLLLNLMPCVLPVLALKAFAVAELAGSHRREALAQGVAYAAGILASMLVLAGVVLSLRAAGSEVGWGFQFQSPGFLVFVSALCVVFALNLFGAFEIGFVPSGLASVGAEAVGARRSFFEGLLAVILATPCSAPFLGTAVGFAFASGGVFVVAIFLAIGFGLASPFLLISAFPPAARWLPRSGAWMLELRGYLGFALLATVVWLVWVMGRSAGPDAVAGLLALLLAVALVVRVFARLEQRPALRGAVLAAGIALVAASPNWIHSESTAATASEQRAAWQPAELARLRAEGRPVLVVFTADWCLTCKVNEQTVLDSDAVQNALVAGGYTVLEADWTRRDEAIRRELARYGKAGVPLYLVYQPGAAEPQVLPELLSVERVLTALEVRERDHAQSTGEADAS
jgi:thiol:disulfide interchange protein DsbD